MIIVEGPDGGGKSTLTKHLHKKYGVALSSSSQLSSQDRNDKSFRSPGAVRDRVYRAVLREATGRKGPELHDRLFFSELIYADVYGRDPCFNFAEQRHICRMMVAFENPVIFCLPPQEEILKKILATDQMEGVHENFSKIYSRYVLMMSMSDETRTGDWGGKMRAANDKTGVGVGKRMRRELNVPRLIHYDYTNQQHLDKIHGVVEKYLSKRALRGVGWTQ